MPSLRKPSPAALARLLAAQAKLDFNYAEVGATASLPGASQAGFRFPAKGSHQAGGHAAPYTVDHTRVNLGEGEGVFDRAVAALRNWRQFRLGWMDVFPAVPTIAVGQLVLVMARAGGLWWTNAARIVYVVEQRTPEAQRFGFAYGTLPAHVETGEERFLVEWNQETDRVHFEILAFSRPRHWLVRIQHRRARALQRRFAEEATESLRRCVTAL